MSATFGARGGGRPRAGAIEWNRDTFRKLVRARPEMLTSRFRLSHGLLLQLLQRETPNSGARGGYGDLAQIIARCHERAPQKRALRREAARLFRSLRAAGVVQTSHAPRVRVEIDAALQDDFSLHHTLSLFLVDLLSELDPAQRGTATRMLSCVEAVLENPGLLLRAQLRKLQRETLDQLKAQRVPYDERIARMRALRPPRPEAAFLDEGLRRFATRHPWMRREFLRPKSIARELLEGGYDFNDYVRHIGVARHEGVLLRYLGQVQTTLEQTVPDALKNAELRAYEDRLRDLLRHADTSLQREWQSQVERAAQAQDADDARAQEQNADAARAQDQNADTTRTLNDDDARSSVVRERDADAAFAARDVRAARDEHGV